MTKKWADKFSGKAKKKNPIGRFDFRIMYYRGLNQHDEMMYFYLGVLHQDYEAIMEEVKTGQLEIGKNCEVLIYGFGDEPTQEEKDFMKEQFLLDHEEMFVVDTEKGEIIEPKTGPQS